MIDPTLDPTLATRTPSPQPTPANEEKTNDPIKETKAANCVPKKKPRRLNCKTLNYDSLQTRFYEFKIYAVMNLCNSTLNTINESEKPENINNTNEEKEKKPKNLNWRTEEDRFLCISWLNTSKDTNIGTGQEVSGFWEGIHASFLEKIDTYVTNHKNDKHFKPFTMRFQGALKSRWVERRLGSGKTRDQIAVEAKELFRADMGTPFTLNHCWLILHNSPKWQETMDKLAARLKKEKQPPRSLPASEGISVKTNEGNEEDNQTDSESLGSSRPEGQKAAKKRKFKETKAPEAQKELIKISREKMATMQTVADDVIMSKDLSAKDPISRAFYTAKKEEIAKRIGLRLSDS
ncbi:hypothetical protein PSTG_01080 [Puccinia striiformis f. sp. tritici PST-78]|uniref:No apical meristem-associated C-terminal domain-containing protein n=1 Tax=Puccinia striiformis f. sp. tritici PST-78 TaxID=1165861 RepID=A0A0L0W2H3_9BASI|nr:hypothetical protein PSTG_01080 [Puccinia striiformis f. sp. tritici PST-78]